MVHDLFVVLPAEISKPPTSGHKLSVPWKYNTSISPSLSSDATSPTSAVSPLDRAVPSEEPSSDSECSSLGSPKSQHRVITVPSLSAVDEADGASGAANANELKDFAKDLVQTDGQANDREVLPRAANVVVVPIAATANEALADIDMPQQHKGNLGIQSSREEKEASDLPAPEFGLDDPRRSTQTPGSAGVLSVRGWDSITPPPRSSKGQRRPKNEHDVDALLRSAPEGIRTQRVRGQRVSQTARPREPHDPPRYQQRRAPQTARELQYSKLPVQSRRTHRLRADAQAAIVIGGSKMTPSGSFRNGQKSELEILPVGERDSPSPSWDDSWSPQDLGSDFKIPEHLPWDLGGDDQSSAGYSWADPHPYQLQDRPKPDEMEDFPMKISYFVPRPPGYRPVNSNSIGMTSMGNTGGGGLVGVTGKCTKAARSYRYGVSNWR